MKIQFTLIVIFLTVLSARSQELILPEDYPVFEVTRTEGVSSGYIFITLQPTIDKTSWVIVMDNFGTPIFYRYYPKVVSHMQLQPSGYLNFTERIGTSSNTTILDSAYNIMYRVPMQNGFRNDRHDFIHAATGEFILIGASPEEMDMSSIVEGGNPAANVKWGMVQVQSAQKEVLLDWNSSDYFDIEDTYVPLNTDDIDNVHTNGLELDLDGNILLSSRNMNEITKIDKITGEVIWRWGGKKNQFTFSSKADTFAYSHDIRVLKNGNYTVFDNGTTHDPTFSRAIEYRLDTDNMTATKVWEFSGDPTVFSAVKGSTQRLDNGNTIIGYGSLSMPGLREVTPDGEIALQINYPLKATSPRVAKYAWKTTALTVNSDSVQFGHWDGTNAVTRDITVKNNTASEMDLSSYHLHSEAFTISGTPLPSSLLSGQELSLTLSFSPDSIESAEVQDILTINSDIDSDTLVQRIAVQVHLSGTKDYLPSGIFSERIQGSIEVYPNPASEQLSIRSSHPISGTLTFYSMDGRVVYSRAFTESDQNFDVRFLKKGLYLLELHDTTSNSSYRRKIVKL